MDPENNALGFYYFDKKSAEKAAKLAGINPQKFAEKVEALDARCIEIFEEYYAEGNASLGYIASRHDVNRPIIYGFAIKYGLNQSYGDKADIEKLNAVKKALNKKK